MAKNNKSNQTKKFYQHFWFWLLIIIIIGIFLGLNLVQKNSPTPTKNTSTHTKIIKKTAVKKVISQATFDSLKVGALENNGRGGTSYHDVINKLGKPTTIKTDTVQGQKVTMVSWDNLGGEFEKVALSFGGDGNQRELSSKSITRPRRMLSSKNITQADYAALKTDGSMKFTDVINKFGQPAMITTVSILNVETKNAVWTNIAPELGNKLTLTISGANTVIDKSYSK